MSSNCFAYTLWYLHICFPLWQSAQKSNRKVITVDAHRAGHNPKYYLLYVSLNK